MSVVAMLSFGTIPIGSVIFYGGIGELIGIMPTFFVNAIILLCGLIWFFTQLPTIRRSIVKLFVEKKLIGSEEEINQI